MMSETKNMTQYVTLSEGQSKRNRITLFVFNLVLLVPALMSSDLSWGLAVAAVFLGLAFYYTAGRKEKFDAAICMLPVLCVYDIAILIAASYQDVFPAFRASGLGTFFDNITTEGLIAFLAGFFLSRFVSDPKWLWLRRLSILLMGIVIVWQSDATRVGSFAGYEKMFVALFVPGAAWFVFCAISEKADKDLVSRNQKLSYLLLALLFVACSHFPAMMFVYSENLYAFLFADLQNTISWGMVVVAAVILLAAMLISVDYKEENLTVDSVFYLFLIGAVILFKVIQDNYFPYNRILLLLFALGSIVTIKFMARERKLLGLHPAWCQILLFVVAVAGNELLCCGMWITALVAAFCGILISVIYAQNMTFRRTRWFWMTLISTPVLIAVSMFLYCCYSLEGLAFLISAYVIFALAMLLLCMPNSNGKKALTKEKAFLVLMLAILCVAMLKGRGASVEIDRNPNAQTMTISIEAAEEDAEIVSAEITWSDRWGNIVKEPAQLKGSSMQSGVLGEKMTIVIVDSEGEQTTYIRWFSLPAR